MLKTVSHWLMNWKYNHTTHLHNMAIHMHPYTYTSQSLIYQVRLNDTASYIVQNVAMWLYTFCWLALQLKNVCTISYKDIAIYCTVK